jgi:alkylation response protein AidB-like acyl-CoA dehydrogenase
MTIALTDDHRALAEVARSFLADRGALRAARDALEAPDEELPPFWKELCEELGWPGIHLPERCGGQGAGLNELVVVVEELGRVVAPGPFLPTVWASGVIGDSDGEDPRDALLADLAAGARIGAVGLGGSLELTSTSAGGRLDGDGGLVLGAGLADVLLLAIGDDMVVVERGADGLEVESQPGLDPTRRLARVTCQGVTVVAGSRLPGARGAALRLGRLLAAAEAAGGARACTEDAVDYAKARVQFGRAIGTFQAVKHRCADMLVDTELAAAVAWDAARADSDGGEAELAAVVAAVQAPAGYLRCAQANVQVHGGIGYTWEHDAHLHLRRASALVALLGGADAAEDVVRLVAAGVRRRPTVDLPPEAQRYRHEARAFRARLDGLTGDERQAAVVDSGYLVPHFPRPFGRSAGPVEQLVIGEELGDLEGPDLGIGIWILPTLIQCASPEQVQRWVRPSLEGRLRWCQLFSEPDAGSDAAGITTRGTRVDGGWLVSGQKVWTSDAHNCNRGLTTVRTDSEAPKHAGVTMMAVDLKAAGVEIRPLREMTGETLFNEIFLDEVFVPDEDVVGEPGQGWRVARATLGNERVTIGRGAGIPTFSAVDLVALLSRHAPDDRGLAREAGASIAEEQAMGLLNLRQATRAVTGGPPGPEGNLTKLLSAEHAQRVTELGLRIAGPPVVAGDEPELAHDLLFTRCLTIAGGTSEISRNQIGERLLGLPRDPLLG